MKTNNILLIGGFFVLCWYLGKRINASKIPVVTVEEVKDGTAPVPGASEVPPQASKPLSAADGNGQIFPASVYQRFAVNQGGESTRILEVSDKI